MSDAGLGRGDLNGDGSGEVSTPGDSSADRVDAVATIDVGGAADAGSSSDVIGSADATGAGGSSGVTLDSGTVDGIVSDAPFGEGCNAVAQLGEMVRANCATGELPIPVGGTIVDGTYVLKALNNYGAECPINDVTQTLVFHAGVLDSVIDLQPMGRSRGSSSYAVSGSSLMLTHICPANAIDSRVSFSVSATGLSLYSNPSPTTTAERVFVRQ